MPIGGLIGYRTPAILGVPNSSEWGGKSEVPIGGRSGYKTPAVLGVPNSSERGGKLEVPIGGRCGQKGRKMGSTHTHVHPKWYKIIFCPIFGPIRANFYSFFRL